MPASNPVFLAFCEYLMVRQLSSGNTEADLTL
jgi:hypothetical protein